jgi:hypothetical protein
MRPGVAVGDAEAVGDGGGDGDCVGVGVIVGDGAGVAVVPTGAHEVATTSARRSRLMQLP